MLDGSFAFVFFGLVKVSGEGIFSIKKKNLN